MAMLAAYGLDNYDNFTEFTTIEPEWTGEVGGSFGSNTLSTTAGRFGGGALIINSGNSGRHAAILNFSVAQPKTIFLGISFKSPVVTITAIFLELSQAGSVHFQLQQVSGGNLVNVRILGSSAGSFTLSKDVWHRIEVKLTVDNAAGEVTVRLDDNEVFTSTGIDTQAGSNAWTDRFIFQAPSSSNTPTVTFDDITINDDQGSANNSFLGDLKIETLRPDADGFVTNFTPSTGSNWENVDDLTGPDEDSTFNESSVAGHQDLYTTIDLSGSPNVVHAVVVRATARKDDAGARSINLLARTGGTTDTGSTQALLTSYSNFQEIHEIDPDTTDAWTVSGVNGLQIGIENV